LFKEVTTCPLLLHKEVATLEDRWEVTSEVNLLQEEARREETISLRHPLKEAVISEDLWVATTGSAVEAEASMLPEETMYLRRRDKEWEERCKVRQEVDSGLAEDFKVKVVVNSYREVTRKEVTMSLVRVRQVTLEDR
jgi:hypothetical protein